MPALHIITGSNGAGKSSIGPLYLPLEIQETCDVFDGDKLFMNLQRQMWQQGMRANKEIKKLAFEKVVETFEGLVENAIEKRIDFVYEGHFTNEETWAVPRRFKAMGYQINLYFLGLSDTDLSQARVVERAKSGGHYVQPRTVSDNFYGNLEKLDIHFEMFDSVLIFDTSGLNHLLLCEIKSGKAAAAVPYHLLPRWFIENLTSISTLIQSGAMA